MECHEGASMIKTFRGLIVHAAIDTIPLQTIDGSIGYRIVKFQLMLPNAASSIKSAVKIYKTPQTTATDDIDFSDNTLLAAALISAKADQTAYPEDLKVIFDQEIFNQDIYVTHIDEHAGSQFINYYIELEQIKLDLNETTVATLKDIRNSPRPS